MKKGEKTLWSRVHQMGRRSVIYGLRAKKVLRGPQQLSKFSKNNVKMGMRRAGNRTQV